MRALAWSLFGFSIVVAAVALGAMSTPAVDSGLATIAVPHHDGLTRRQLVDLVIAVVFLGVAVLAAIRLTVGTRSGEGGPVMHALAGEPARAEAGPAL